MSQESPYLQAARLLAEAYHHLLSGPESGPDAAARQLERLGRLRGLPPEIGAQAAAQARRCQALGAAAAHPAQEKPPCAQTSAL